MTEVRPSAILFSYYKAAQTDTVFIIKTVSVFIIGRYMFRPRMSLLCESLQILNEGSEYFEREIFRTEFCHVTELCSK